MSSNWKASTNSRSLTDLVVEFCKIIQKSSHLNLNQALSKINLSSRRRIYDVTGALQGIGLIEKCAKTKSCFKWIATADTKANLEKLKILHAQNHILNNMETKMDWQLKVAKQSSALEKRNANKFAYVNYKDLIDTYKDETILTFKNQTGVSKPKVLQDSQIILNRHLVVKSDNVLDCSLVSLNATPIKSELNVVKHEIDDDDDEMKSQFSFSKMEIKAETCEINLEVD